METQHLSTVAFAAAQMGVGYGVLNSGVRDYGIRPQLVLNALEYYLPSDLQHVLCRLVNERRVTHRIVLEGTATIHAPAEVQDE